MNFQKQVERNLLGKKFEKNGEIELAIQEYEKNILEKFEGNFPYDRLAIIYHKRGDYKNETRVLIKAIETFERLKETTLRKDIDFKLERFRKRLKKVIN